MRTHSAATPRARRALFVFSIVHYYREMWPVAEHYGRAGYDVHVLLGYEGPLAEEASSTCRAAGMWVHWPPAEFRFPDPIVAGRAKEAAGQPGSSGQVVHRRGEARPRVLLGRLARLFASHLRRNLRVRRYAEELLAAIQPDVVFAGPYHSCGQIDNALACMVRRRGVRYCCLSVSPYLGERHAVGARFSNVDLGMLSREIEVSHSLVNRLLAWLFPAWTRARDSRRLFMFDPVAMTAAKVMGLLERNPWQKPSVQYDLVFVESEFSRDMLVASGYDAGKVVVGGKPLLDRVFAKLADPAHAAELHRTLGLEAGESFVLCNVEPSAEHAYATWEDHWQRFFAVMESLKAVGGKVVLSLHPLCDPERYRFVEDKYGFKVSTQYGIVDLYPYCRLVVSFPCSTNLLASVFGKPLVVYDFFGLTREGAPRGDLYRLPGAVYAYDAVELAIRIDEAVERASHGKATLRDGLEGSACERIRRQVQDRLGV